MAAQKKIGRLQCPIFRDECRGGGGVLVLADQRERPTTGRHLADQRAVCTAVEKLEAQPFGFFEVFEYEHTLHGLVPLFSFLCL
jgi:hypothetical protein